MSALEEKTTRSKWVLALLLIPLGPAVVAGCGGGGSAPEPEPAPALNTETAPSWESVLGKQLRSVEPHPGGLGEYGELLWGHQSLTLAESGDTFRWTQSDYTDSGTFRRNGARVFIRLRGQIFEGEFVPERGVLIWDGVEFELP